MSTESPRPLWYLAGLPGFPDITVLTQPCGHGEFQLDYCGWPEELVAAGVMQPEWIKPTGKHLRDPDGRKVSVSRRWRVIGEELPPRRYCVVRRDLQLLELSRWPGALEALDAYEKHQRWRPPGREPATRPKPTLHLVVDKTPTSVH